MNYDYSKLAGRIVEIFGTRAAFAEQMGVSEHSISCKLNNKTPWKQTEMAQASRLLGFPLSDLQLYFFCPICSK